MGLLILLNAQVKKYVLISISQLFLWLQVFCIEKSLGKNMLNSMLNISILLFSVENIGGGRKTASPKPEEEPTEEFDIKKYVEDQLRFSKNPYYDED